MKKVLFIVFFGLLSLFVVPCSFSQEADPYPFGPVGRITDKAFIEGSGILEYGLFNVPVGESNDIDLYMKVLVFPGLEVYGMPELGGRYILDAASARLIENNTSLSINVKRLMARHGCNASVTYRDNTNGSTTFWFNFYNSNGNYETWYFNAYRR
jgi:hypothetical protein